MRLFSIGNAQLTACAWRHVLCLIHLIQGLKMALERILEETGADILFHTKLAGVQFDDALGMAPSMCARAAPHLGLPESPTPGLLCASANEIGHQGEVEGQPGKVLDRGDERVSTRSVVETELQQEPGQKKAQERGQRHQHGQRQPHS